MKPGLVLYISNGLTFIVSRAFIRVSTGFLRGGNASQPFRNSFIDPLSVDNIACPVEFGWPPTGACGRGTFVENEVEGEFVG